MFFKFAARFNFLLVVIWAASRSEQRDAPSNIQLQAAQAARKKSQDPTQQTFNVSKEATGNQGYVSKETEHEVDESGNCTCKSVSKKRFEDSLMVKNNPYLYRKRL
ncbi:hypothetical protein BGZ57DRAFT_913295 [Hyaloscypha finlandica]|nr:hypothetical protein BGZ57DRAFT_913295 [Hyaloscypha finlandica]KAH8754940.1 hypothetical protein F5882DRAFT_51354 [Hyaloscypha sp. PMI_1271]